MGPHAGFIVAAFLVTGLVLGGTLVVVLLDYRAQVRALARLSGQSPRRGRADLAQDERL